MTTVVYDRWEDGTLVEHQEGSDFFERGKAIAKLADKANKPWQSLTEEEARNIFLEFTDWGGDIGFEKVMDLYAVLDKALKDKNHV